MWKRILAIVLIIICALLIFKECKSSKGLIITDHSAYKQDTSKIVIPIQIDISSFEETFNTQMDEKGWFFEENGIEVNRQLSISFKVKKDGRAQLYPQDGQIQLQLPLFIDISPKIRSSLSLGLGKNMNLQGRVLLKSKIDVDIEEDWDLFTDAHTTFTVTQSPALNVLGLNFDFEKQLEASLNEGVGEINKQIEEQIKQAINTKEIVQLIWDEIKSPYQISENPFNAWININPLSIEVAALKPSGPGIIETIFLVNCLLNVDAGTLRPNNIMKKLPNATKVESIKNKYTVAHFPLVVSLNSFADYLNVSTSPTEIQVAGNNNLILSNYEASAKSGLLHLIADFKLANTTGKLELKGLPALDAENQTIYIKNLSIQTVSNNKVVDASVKTLQKSNSVIKAIENKLMYNLTNDLSSLSFTITNQLQNTQFNEYAYLDGYLNSLKVKDIFLEAEGLVIDTYLDASTVCVVSEN